MTDNSYASVHEKDSICYDCKQGCQQKIFQGGKRATKKRPKISKKYRKQHYLASSREGGGSEKNPKNSKKRPKNSIFKPLSTIFVPCLKIQRGAHGPPAADAHD